MCRISSIGRLPCQRRLSLKSSRSREKSVLVAERESKSAENVVSQGAGDELLKSEQSRQVQREQQQGKALWSVGARGAEYQGGSVRRAFGGAEVPREVLENQVTVRSAAAGDELVMCDLERLDR